MIASPVQRKKRSYNLNIATLEAEVTTNRGEQCHLVSERSK
jgi:hypothetical protein